MHRGVGIADNPFEPVADARRLTRALELDGAVLGRKPRGADGPETNRLRRRSVAAHRLLAGIADDAVWRWPAGDGGHDGERIRMFNRKVLGVVHVAEHAAAGLNFGDAALRSRNPVCPGPAAAHDFDRKS